MLSLSAIARKEKNELSTDSAFIVLLDIRLGEETVRIENTDGSDPDVELKVDNVSQALQYAVEEANGGNGTEVILRVVNSLALETGYAEMEEFFVVTKTQVDQQYITFHLGSEYSSRNSCSFKYKDVRCGCTSNYPTCDHTLTDCRARGNSHRFGAFQGIDQKGVYVH